MGISGIQSGDLTYLQYLLDSRADVTSPDADGVTLLMLVGTQGSNKAQVAQWLITHNADIDAADDVGRTPLWYAVRGGDVSLVQVFSGAAVKDAHDHYGVSVLTLAIWQNSVAMVSQLLSMGCNVNYPDSMGGDTPLKEAAKSTNPFIRALFGLP